MTWIWHGYDMENHGESPKIVFRLYVYISSKHLLLSVGSCIGWYLGTIIPLLGWKTRPDMSNRKPWVDIFWLVVGPPLWKIWKSIGMMIIPSIWENKKCSKPPTSILYPHHIPHEISTISPLAIWFFRSEKCCQNPHDNLGQDPLSGDPKHFFGAMAMSNSAISA